MRMEAPWSRWQITCSGLRISTSEPASMSPALTGPAPSFFSTMRLTPSEWMRSAISLMLRMMLVTSSRTPGIEENSCSTPSICTVLIAAPCSEDSSTRRSALPSVMPKPRSSGSATMVATRSRSRPGLMSSFVGLIRSCQFFCRTVDWSSGPRIGSSGGLEGEPRAGHQGSSFDSAMPDAKSRIRRSTSWP